VRSARVSKFVPILFGCCVFLALPAVASAASISGTVRDNSASHEGIAGIEVCAWTMSYRSEERCAQTAAGGTYVLNDLTPFTYYLRFSGAPNRLNFVRGYYGDTMVFPGDPLAVSGDLTGIDTELTIGGVLRGTATDESTLGPAVGAEACASSFEPVEYTNCGLVGADGKYEINALPDGNYAVDFFGGSDANYLRRDYHAPGEPPGTTTRVPVTAGAPPVEGIDVTLQPGAQIFGTVTEAGTGAPQLWASVCLYDSLRAPEVGWREPCVLTNEAGQYAIRSLRAGVYYVVFSPNGPYENQWFDGVPTLAQATPIAIAPPETRSGVDARLVGYPTDPPRQEPIRVDFIPTPGAPPTLKCKKNQRKKWVRGKQRCVKKPRRHGKHRHGGRGHGPQAVATDR